VTQALANDSEKQMSISFEDGRLSILLAACGLTEADQSCKYFLIIPLFVSLSSGVIKFTDANLLKMRS